MKPWKAVCPRNQIIMDACMQRLPQLPSWAGFCLQTGPSALHTSQPQASARTIQGLLHPCISQEERQEDCQNPSLLSAPLPTLPDPLSVLLCWLESNPRPLLSCSAEKSKESGNLEAQGFTEIEFSWNLKRNPWNWVSISF